ncbi:2-phosphosulfolactate phosphatase [Microbacterium sp. SLBN-146]|nr:2-phosphosulfolactate phosphatase [Microbacterium sp. SLBN-146]
MGTGSRLEGVTGTSSQSIFQVRLGWGGAGLEGLAAAPVVVIVDAIGTADDLVARAVALPHRPVVFAGSLRNATATAKAAYDVQIDSGDRTAINLVLVGDDGCFAVEDYLAAGAISDALTQLGIDHSAPDVAVAAEGFRALTRALTHLLSASASGLALAEAGRRADVKAAAALDAETEATRVDA